MSQSIFHVRPLDAGKGWAIDEYDGRGAWQRTIPIGPDGAPMDKQQPDAGLVDAAAVARKLLHRLTGRIDIDDALRAEIDAAERALWDALFPRSAVPECGAAARDQVEDGLAAELDGSDYFTSSAMAESIRRGIRRGGRGF